MGRGQNIERFSGRGSFSVPPVSMLCMLQVDSKKERKSGAKEGTTSIMRGSGEEGAGREGCDKEVPPPCRGVGLAWLGLAVMCHADFQRLLSGA